MKKQNVKMKRDKIVKKLNVKKSSVSVSVGDPVFLFYYQEGKRLAYYTGILVKKNKKQWLVYRSSDRSFQQMPLKSPVFLIQKGTE